MYRLQFDTLKVSYNYSIVTNRKLQHLESYDSSIVTTTPSIVTMPGQLQLHDSYNSLKVTFSRKFQLKSYNTSRVTNTIQQLYNSSNTTTNRKLQVPESYKTLKVITPRNLQLLEGCKSSRDTSPSESGITSKVATHIEQKFIES